MRAQATIELLQALRQKRDRSNAGRPPSISVGALMSRFFPYPLPFPLGPFLLSPVSGAPVLPGFVIRQGWLRYRALVGDPVPASSIAGNTRKTGCQPAGSSLPGGPRFLEKTLMTHYDQWMNFFDLWPANSRD